MVVVIFKKKIWDFPGDPVAKTPRSQCRGLGSIPGQGTRSHMPQLKKKIPQATMKTEDFVMPQLRLGAAK